MAQFVKLNPETLQQLRVVDARLVSYDVEMAEVTGGTFWRAYTPAQIAGEEEFELKKGTGGQMMDKNALMQYYDPINLYDEKLRKLAKEIGPAWVRVSGTWATKTYYDFDGHTGGTAPEGYDAVLTREQWLGVLDFCKEIGAKLLISVADCDGLHHADALWNPSQAEQIMAAFARQAPTALRVNTLKTTPAALIAQLKQEGAEAVEGPVPGSLLAKFEGSPAATKAFARGLYHVQGLASQLAALSLDARPGQKVLDLCAAPGGKTVTLAQCMNNEGRLYSCDVAINRLQLIFHSLERCHITNTIVTRQDAAQYNPELCEADRVLCDVPCSGLGILAKKPDIRYKTLEGLEELCALQAKILRTAAGYVKPGGRLVYSTCTINPMENEEIIRAFLNEQPGWHLVPPWMTPPTARVSNGGMTLLPDGEGMDGFFIAVLEKD